MQCLQLVIDRMKYFNSHRNCCRFYILGNILGETTLLCRNISCQSRISLASLRNPNKTKILRIICKSELARACNVADV